MMRNLLLCLFLVACDPSSSLVVESCAEEQVWLLDLSWTEGTCGVDGDETTYWIYMTDMTVQTSWADDCTGSHIGEICSVNVKCNGLADNYGYEITFDLGSDGEAAYGAGRIDVHFLVFESDCFQDFVVSGEVR